MTGLIPLQDCLAQALDGLSTVRPQAVPVTSMAMGFLAQDLIVQHDMPPQAEALRAGYAVTALDLTGASAEMPIPLVRPVRVTPGDTLPSGCDAVLPPEYVEETGTGHDATRSVGPGEGTRHAGHDGRSGIVLAQAGARFSPRLAFVAALSGHAAPMLCRPTVRNDLMDPVHAAFVNRWAQDLGVELVSGSAALALRSTPLDDPRLAYAPAETAWLARADDGLVLDLPTRFDGLVGALLGLGLPAICHLSAARRRTVTWPLARKLSSTVGVSELVLLAEEAGEWMPSPPGHLTLASLARASAFAILPAQSEGLPAGAPLAATPLDHPLV